MRQMVCRILLDFAAHNCAAVFPNEIVRRWCLRFPLLLRVCVSVTFYAELNVWFSVLLAMGFCIEHVVIRFCGMPFHSLGVRLHFRPWFGWRRYRILAFLTLASYFWVAGLCYVPELPISIWCRGVILLAFGYGLWLWLELPFSFSREWC